jgi:hypothetical protein
MQKRNCVPSRHWNIISGGVQNSDVNPIHTALREFCEEAGKEADLPLSNALHVGLVVQQVRFYVPFPCWETGTFLNVSSPCWEIFLKVPPVVDRSSPR